MVQKPVVLYILYTIMGSQISMHYCLHATKIYSMLFGATAAIALGL